jgi:hypothetical protein
VLVVSTLAHDQRTISLQGSARPVGAEGGYVLGFDEIFRKIEETIELGGGQLLLHGFAVDILNELGHPALLERGLALLTRFSEA